MPFFEVKPATQYRPYLIHLQSIIFFQQLHCVVQIYFSSSLKLNKEPQIGCSTLRELLYIAQHYYFHYHNYYWYVAIRYNAAILFIKPVDDVTKDSFVFSRILISVLKIAFVCCVNCSIENLMKPKLMNSEKKLPNISFYTVTAAHIEYSHAHELRFSKVCFLF